MTSIWYLVIFKYFCNVGLQSTYADVIILSYLSRSGHFAQLGLQLAPTNSPHTKTNSHADVHQQYMLALIPTL